MDTTIDPDVVAAGAVLWRPAPGPEDKPRLEVAVVHRPRYDDWSLPKGKVESGESVEAAAVREVAEETGSTAALGVRLGESHYRVPQGEKVVRYWSARAVTGAFIPNSEVDHLRWLPVAEAEELLSYDRDGEVLARFGAVSSSGRPPNPLLLVRHAKAGSPATWTGDDDLRPLSGKGHRQAGDVARLLSLFGPARAYAAPPVRCRQTLGPLAERFGLDIATEPLLGEHGYWDDPDGGLDRLVSLGRGAEVAVMCSQGGVIPDLVERLTGRPVAPARKASTWVLGFTDDQLTTADHYPPDH